MDGSRGTGTARFQWNRSVREDKVGESRGVPILKGVVGDKKRLSKQSREAQDCETRLADKSRKWSRMTKKE